MNKIDNFILRNLDASLLSTQFPPKRFKFQYLDNTIDIDTDFFYLGESTKKDLIPQVLDHFSSDLIDAISNDLLKQFTYITKENDVFDVALYRGKSRLIYLYGIVTNERPKKKKKIKDIIKETDRSDESG